MKKLNIIVAATLLMASAFVNAQTLEELAESVRQAANSEGKINKQREAEFLSDRNNQRNLLAQAKAELQREEKRSDNLKSEYNRLERELAEQTTILQERMGNLGELFGIVRQSSGDIQAALNDSMVTSQFPGRDVFLSELAQVVKYTTQVERANGAKEEVEVVRVGVFNAVTNGSFLDWDSSKSTVNLIELARQPTSRFRSMASDLQNTAAGQPVAMAVDFTRGQILRAVVQSKTPIERVKEDGGPVGMVIIGVGIFGLLLCFWKALVLYTTGGRMSKQLKTEDANKGNPLGRVMAIYTDNTETDIETLELKLDEAILRESAPLETGLSFIKVLYVVAPLLGLLGTVVGMIATFQMITLFGTGDPRMMAGGISTALVTTVLGLVVAIPLTIFHAFLQGKSKALIQILEEQAAGIIARLAERNA